VTRKNVIIKPIDRTKPPKGHSNICWQVAGWDSKFPKRFAAALLHLERGHLVQRESTRLIVCLVGDRFYAQMPTTKEHGPPFKWELWSPHMSDIRGEDWQYTTEVDG
jgi:hypothetical protein